MTAEWTADRPGPDDDTEAALREIDVRLRRLKEHRIELLKSRDSRNVEHERFHADKLRDMVGFLERRVAEQQSEIDALRLLLRQAWRGTDVPTPPYQEQGS